MKSIGIIGGMGPLATYDLFGKIIKNTDAKKDQDHVHIYIDNNTEIPDRTSAILGKGESPVPQLVRSAIKLESLGADALVMPCNTAHYFYEDIVKYIHIPMIHMPKETAVEVKKSEYRKVGILATEGTYKSGIYQKAFDEEAVEYIVPSAEEQKVIMSVIYDGIKSSNYNIDLEGFYSLLDSMLNQGAEAFVLACTELPLAFEVFNIDYPNIDPTDILAKKAVKFAMKGKSNPVENY